MNLRLLCLQVADHDGRIRRDREALRRLLGEVRVQVILELLAPPALGDHLYQLRKMKGLGFWPILFFRTFPPICRFQKKKTSPSDRSSFSLSTNYWLSSAVYLSQFDEICLIVNSNSAVPSLAVLNKPMKSNSSKSLAARRAPPSEGKENQLSRRGPADSSPRTWTRPLDNASRSPVLPSCQPSIVPWSHCYQLPFGYSALCQSQE